MSLTKSRYDMEQGQSESRPEGRQAFNSVSVEVKVGTECLLKGANDQITTVIGSLNTHTATSSHPIQSVQWTIEGRQNTVANYVTSTNSGTVTLLTDEDLTKNPITFAWWRSGTYKVTATITTSDGTEVVTNTFVVTAPLVRDVNWNEGEGVVAVGSYREEGQMIRFADESNFNKDGLYMNFVVGGVQSSPGILAGIQLACNQRVAEYNDGKFFKRAINGIFVLDVGLTNTVLYQNYTEPLDNTGGTATYDPHDGPGQGLNITDLKAMYIGDGNPEVVPETYLMYAMFKPNLPAAIWVPIKVLKWGWEGYTDYISGAWTPAKDGEIPTPVPSDPSNFPEWDKNTNDNNWVPYGGKVIARKLAKKIPCKK